MPTLVLANSRRVPLEIASSRPARRRGLLGRDSVDGGAMLIMPCRNVHTVGMRFAIDVAHLSASNEVLRVRMMKSNRLGRTAWHSRAVLEADAGAFAAWGLQVGDRLFVQP